MLAAMCWVVALPALGQMAAITSPAFDAVSIKAHDPNAQGTRIQVAPTRFSGQNVSLKFLMTYAYNLKSEDQVVGLSGPLGSARFDIEAKMDEETVEAFKKLPRQEADDKRRLMLQGMLADRFKLIVHHETKELPMYALVVAKGGSKLKEADPNDTYPNGVKGPDGVGHSGMMMMRGGSLTGQGITMESLASSLTRQVSRIVEDKTGLRGKYDFTLQWAPDEMADSAKDATGENAMPSLFTALQEQLGLKLDSIKGPVDTIAVDHVEMPSEN